MALKSKRKTKDLEKWMGQDKIWVFPKIGGKPPQIINSNRVFHYFHHPFWGTIIFGNTHINLEPETSTLKWLFQLDASKSLYEKWLFHHFHPLKHGCLEFQEMVFPTLPPKKGCNRHETTMNPPERRHGNRGNRNCGGEMGAVGLPKGGPFNGCFWFP